MTKEELEQFGEISMQNFIKIYLSYYVLITKALQHFSKLMGVFYLCIYYKKEMYDEMPTQLSYWANWQKSICQTKRTC